MSNENCEPLYSFAWKIENFPFFTSKNGEYISSPHFTIETLNNSKWSLIFYPKGADVESQDYSTVSLLRKDKISDWVLIDFKIKAFTGDGKLFKSEEFADKIFSRSDSWGTDHFFKTDEFMINSKNWKNPVLTLSCEISSKQKLQLLSKQCVLGCEARTIIGVDKYATEWTIKLSNSPENNRIIPFIPVSIEISVSASKDDIKIDICPTEIISIGSKTVFCRLAVLDINGMEVFSKYDNHQFANESNVWKFPSFATRKQLQDCKDVVHPSNSFTLRCSVFIAKGSLVSYIENYLFHPVQAEKSIADSIFSLKHDHETFSVLQADLQRMFSLKKHCDVELQADNHTIPAHKAILSTRSPVFSTMFDQDMSENQTGVVFVEDINAETLNALLEFIYTGSIPKLDYWSVSNLIIAADKYQILSLERKCSDCLVSMMSESNVCNVLTVADIISYPPLKESAMNYLMNNYKKVMSSDEWTEWVKVNNILATEVLLKVTDFVKNEIKIF